PVTEATHDENGYLLDDLPDDLDFGGATVNMLTWDDYEVVEFEMEEATGDVLDDALYQRNMTVEERLGVNLTFHEISVRSDYNLFQKTVQQTVMSGSGEYDIASCETARFAISMLDGMMLDLMEIDYIDISKPWWSDRLLESSVINDHLYFITGDLCTSATLRIQGIYINQTLLEQYKLENPYELVLDGSWTNDKMLSMTKGVYRDLNANNEKDINDQFGIIGDHIQFQGFYTAAGLKSVEETDDGRVILSEDVTSERAVDLMEKMANFFNTQIDAIVTPKYDDTTHFREGRGLFYTYPMGPLAKATYRSLPFNVGFVPMPKYDETEKEYTISSSNSFSLFGIPVDAKDPHMSGAVLECMASEGYRTLIPALFDVCYKVKYNSDESGLQSQVFDLIRENRVFDLGRFFYRVLPYAVVNNFGKNISVNNTAWVSTIEGVRASLDTKLAEITEIMAKIES
ncbi:MAG: hypothetical protein J6C52_05645, partial [Clostridia bacterium]|nr:hypothetical protein [Clostridia bacterium]